MPEIGCGQFPVADELEKLFPGAGVLVREVQPVWIELHFPDHRKNSLIRSHRFYYLLQRYGLGEASRILENPAMGIDFEETIPIRSHSDRVFSVMDWGRRKAAERYGCDIRAFAKREQSFEWIWNFYHADSIDRETRGD